MQTAQNRSYEALKHGAKWMKAERVMILYDTLMLYQNLRLRYAVF